MKRLMMGLALMPCMAFATTWYVDGTNGSDENSGTSPTTAKATIQAVIDLSVDGDEILVASGTYAPIMTNNKLIHIVGEKTSDVIIDGGNVQRCVKAYYDVDDFHAANHSVCTNSIIENVIIQNGSDQNGTDWWGTGCAGGTLKNCIVRNNSNTFTGGGCKGSILENSLLYNNSSKNGGAGESCVFIGCTVAGNSVSDNGAAGWDCAFLNCIVFDNLGLSTFYDVRDDDPTAPQAILNYCKENLCLTNPNFVDAANGDYRLAVGSPCIDAGDNSYVVGDKDLEGLDRIATETVDIGCYEYGSSGGPFVEKIGETNWTYMIKNGKASVGDGVNAAVANTISGLVAVPDTLRQRPVVAIDNNGFKDCTNMTAVTIPASVKTIGASAFEGCGKMADVYFEGDTLSSIGVDAFKGCYWDLIMHMPETWQGRGRTLCGYSVWKGEDPNEVVRVVSTNVVVHYMTTNVPVEVVAPISPDTGIVNVMTEVKGGNVAIPDSWAKNFPTFEEKFGSDFTDALTKPTGKFDCNGGAMQVWQDYVAGTDPTNLDDVFTATITMVDDVPQVQWKPVLSAEAAEKRIYRKFGKARLQDGWVEIPAGHEADYNFFKVTVEMK